ncbi:MAG: hypothetical protein ABIN39_01870 [candidate division WOR-3 bacterium]
MKRIIIFFPIILALFLLSCSGPYNPFSDSAGKEVMPVDPKKIYIYSVINNGTNTYYNVSKLEYFYNENQIEIDTGDKLWVLNKYAYDQNGYLLWYYDNIYYSINDFGFFSYGTSLFTDYPIKFLDFPLYEGKKWEGHSGNYYFFSSYDTLVASVEGKEDVNGYDGCWKVKVKFFEREIYYGYVYEYIRWYKEGVGMVKDSEYIYDVYGFYVPVSVVLNLDTIIER